MGVREWYQPLFELKFLSLYAVLSLSALRREESPGNTEHPAS